ncbi:hypothetical protein METBISCDRAFT_23031 [Metschnikowia bicuspidata]|uniref:Sec39 domain-containing protein n=1 Tax=Metschnikowia bicuspidata TaxID=27322 RepID=A0A4V1J347_9ASCO|nr:hypothetical protein METBISCDRAFT_23031 [Metschnikowia bicuspidata]
MPTALEEADARLYVLLCMVVLLRPAQIELFFGRISPVAASRTLHYSTPQNLLRISLLHTVPVSVPLSAIFAVAQELVAAAFEPVETVPDDLLEDVQDLGQWLESELAGAKNEAYGPKALIQAAQELVDDAQTRAAALGFDTNATGYQELSFSFARAKTLQLASYIPNLTEYSPLYLLLYGYSPFDAWNAGVLAPYQYFWENVSLESSSALPSQFLALVSHFEQFQHLIAPVESFVPMGGKLTVSMYLSKVILPLAVYHGDDLNPLSSWMNQNHSLCDLSAEFLFWDLVLRTVASFRNYKEEGFSTEACANLLRHYAAVGLFYGIYVEPKMGSVEKIRIHEQIRATTEFLAKHLQLAPAVAPVALPLAQLPENALFAEFVFVSCISACLRESYQNVLAYLHKAVSTCCVLFPINGMIIRTFHELLQDSWVEPMRVRKEVLLIFAHVSEKNYRELTSALGLFCEVFLGDRAARENEIAVVVFERLLDGKMFRLAGEFLTQKDPATLSSGFFAIVMAALWANFNAALTLDEVLAPGGATQQALAVVESLILHCDVDKHSRAQVVRMKHLFRALNLLKNFRFHLAKGTPVSAKAILERLTRADTEESFTPMSLVSVILQQNRKAYLVHEKLYKICVELAIYLGLDDTWASFYKVRASCIESALVERDYAFAYKHSKELIVHAVDQHRTDTLSDIWLVFYQVGKFAPREWLDDFDPAVHAAKQGILLQQREILSLALRHIARAPMAADNSRLLVAQFRSVNDEIDRWYAEEMQVAGVADAMHSSQTGSSVASLTGNLGEKTKSQAGDKISSLLVSGLGWAIGVNGDVV